VRVLLIVLERLNFAATIVLDEPAVVQVGLNPPDLDDHRVVGHQDAQCANSDDDRGSHSVGEGRSLAAVHYASAFFLLFAIILRSAHRLHVTPNDEKSRRSARSIDTPRLEIRRTFTAYFNGRFRC
jgi:hypothetical protein